MRPEDDPGLVELLAVALAARDSGEPVDVDAICKQHPHLRAALAEALAATPGFADSLRQLRAAAVTHDSLAGSLLAERYRLQARLGAGSMGVVYRAHDEELGRDVAVKLLHTDLLAGQEATARFVREAEVLAAVSHPAIVAVYDRGHTSTGGAFLVMELLAGHTAQQWIEHGRDAGGAAWHLTMTDGRGETRLRNAVRWIAELADGLAAVHAAGVLHRDLKPSNVFVRTDGRPVLLDFGVAARLAEQTLAERDKAIGTPAYLAPELLQPGGVASVASDVYGLGATLYALLSLRAPYAGTLSQVVALAQRRDPIPASRWCDLPRDLQAVLDRAMERDPARRYPNVAALAADLRAFLEHRPVTARPISSLRRWLRRARRSPMARSSAALVLLAGVGIGIAAAVQAEASARADRGLAGWVDVPPAQQLSGIFAARVLPDAERRRITSLLDQAVGMREAFAPLLLRAALRLDHGDAVGAASDAAQMAALVGGEYARAVATWYATTEAAVDHPAPAAGFGCEPRTAAERQIAAFHELRAPRTPERVLAACALLSGDNLGATGCELLLVALLERAVVVDARSPATYRLVHDTALRAEHLLGRASATTSFALGTAATAEDRHEESIEHYRAVLAKVPTHFGARCNLGVALRSTRRLPEAIAELRAAIALRPEVVLPHQTLVRALMDSFDWSGARAAALEFPRSPDGDRARAVILGPLELNRAVNALARGENDVARAAAQAALDNYDVSPPSEDVEFEQLIAASIASGDYTGMTVKLLQWMTKNPTSWNRLQDVIELLPPELDSDQTDAVRDYLRALTRKAAPQPENREQAKQPR